MLFIGSSITSGRAPRFGAILILFAAAAFLAGCGSAGPKLYGVSGTVKYKGEPIKAGNISFRADNGVTGGAEIKDGKYEIPAAAGLQEGKYRVAISYPDPKIPAPRPDEPPGPAVQKREMLPEKIANGTTLTADIQPQTSNDVSFDLK